MPKFKSLPIVAGAAALGLVAFVGLPASADVVTSTLNILSPGGGLPDVTGNFGTVTITLLANTTAGCSTSETGCADVKFTNAAGFDFIDSNIANLNTAVTAAPGNPSVVTTFTATTPSGLTDSLNTNGAVDGFGKFNVQTNAGGICTGSALCPTVEYLVNGSFTSASQLLVDNGSGFDASAHVIGAACSGGTGALTCFAGETVPAPAIGHGLLVLLAIGSVLAGGKLLEGLKKQRLNAA